MGKTESVLSCLCLLVGGIPWKKQKIWVPPFALEAKEVGIKIGRDTYCPLYTLLWSWKYLSYTFFLI